MAADKRKQDDEMEMNGGPVSAASDEERPKVAEKQTDELIDMIKAMAMAAMIALTIRTFVFEPFNIPSGSMLPTLQIGDYLFVEKYAYGYSKYSFPLEVVSFDGRVMEGMPKRGDVAVFRQPKKPQIDYIKRLIGLPGDRIQVRGGVLHINGVAVLRDFLGTENIDDGGMFHFYTRYIETLPNDVKHYIYEISDFEALDDTEVFTVPPGYYFAMGDNRDSSLDSRVQEQVGFVPAENLVGRAAFIFFSTEGIGDKCFREGTFAALQSLGCKLIEWPKAIRYNRILKSVNSL